MASVEQERVAIKERAKEIEAEYEADQERVGKKMAVYRLAFALARDQQHATDLLEQLDRAERIVRVFVITAHNAADHPDPLATCRYSPCAPLRPALSASGFTTEEAR